MDNINFQEILRLILPGSATLIWDIFLIPIFFLGLFALFRMPDKNMVPTLLTGGVLVAAVVAKLSITADTLGEDSILEAFGFLVVNAAMMLFPLIAAGTLRAKKKGPVIGFLILIGILAAVYFFLYGLLELNWFRQ
jgi:DMSO/TMAO reductase YedYZ heme-binding membrane subunit